MTTFYAYTDGNLQYLGEVQAIDIQVAQLLAGEVWGRTLHLTTARLLHNGKLAA